MYEELVERLRSCASSTVEDCDGCPYIGGYNGTYCMNGLITEAADAIEQLSNAGSAYGRGWTLGYDAGREENKPLPEPPKEEQHD